MNTFLEEHKLPKLKLDLKKSLKSFLYKILQKFLKISNKSIPIKKKKSRTHDQNLPVKKTPVSDGFTYEFYQAFKEEVIAITLILLQHTKGGNDSHPFYEASIILIPENDKDITKNENSRRHKDQKRRSKSFMNTEEKKFNKISAH